MDYLNDLDKTFQKLLGDLREEFSLIRTNRPTSKLIEDINAIYMNQPIPIKQLGTISVEPPRNLVISPWDKGSINSIAKAIDDAKLGFTSSVMGDVIRITLPQLTDERREELSRVVRKTSEEIRIKMRVARDEVNKRINQEPDEDIKFKNKERLQKLVDSFNEAVDGLVGSKITEISQ